MNVRKIIFIGLALFAAQFTWVVYNTYVPLFLQNGSNAFDAPNRGQPRPGFGLSATQAGFILTLDNIAALLLQPLLGARSDHTRTRWGRRIPYLLFGMPAAAFGLVLMPLLLPGAGGPTPAIFTAFLSCLLLTAAAMATWRAPAFALMADLTPSAQRSQANGILNLMAGVGGILAFGVSSMLYARYRPFPFWVAALILLAAALLIVWRVREPAEPAADTTHEVPALGRWLWEWGKSLPTERRRSLALLAAGVFCYMMGFHPIEAFFSSYAVSVLKLSEAHSGLVLSAAYITFVAFAMPGGLLAGRIGRKHTVQIGLLLFATALLSAYFTPVTPVLVVLMGLGGLGWALVDINAFAMALDTVGGDTSGRAAGVYFIATTLAATLGPTFNGWLIDLSGRNYGTIFLIGPAFFGLAFWCISQVKYGEAMS
ncbi:MAG: MFS transporter [Chloroflexota bacterium]